jgi:rhodanese-related sulfurtransferase
MFIRVSVTGIILLFVAGWHTISGEIGDHSSGWSAPVIGTLTQAQILDAIRQGKKVWFIDAREPEEFAEEHLPHAILLPLRDVDGDTISLFAPDDIIISYCLKDFRGYEVARALLIAGKRRVYTMQAHGLNGWRARGLPRYIRGRVSDEQAMQQLLACTQKNAPCTHLLDT